MGVNAILAACGEAACARLRGEVVPLRAGQPLAQRGSSAAYALFPTSGLVSVLGLTAQGQALELAAISNREMLGWQEVFGLPSPGVTAVTQVAGEAVRVRVEVLAREMGANPQVRRALRAAAAAALEETVRRLLCHRFHPVLERACSWMLATGDRLRTDTIWLTQDSAAQLLGIPRTSLTRVTVALQDAGAVWCRRGRIRVLDRKRLERTACACYGMWRATTCLAFGTHHADRSS